MADAPTYDGHSAGAIARRLDVPQVHLFDLVESTQDVAHAVAQDGAPAGSVVLADTQHRGRGRQGRAWASGPGGGVWCSVIERIADRAAIEVLSLRVGLAVAERLDALAGATVGLKWPNDLYLGGGKLGGGKLGGILAEARWSGDAVAWVSVGIGVNVESPKGVEGAASLAGASRLDVLAAIVAGVRAAASAFGGLTEGELNRYRGRDILSGRQVAAPEAGTVRGIDPSGALLVETSGGVRAVRTGTVEMAGEGIA